jgi:redox-sensing transcriptional repressor
LKPKKQRTGDHVPPAVVSRLSLYLRELQRLINEGRFTISSVKLGRMLGVTDAQVRKDFATFGQFGQAGIGYRCEELVHEIRRILGTDREWPVLLVGCGNLGQALLGYRGFRKQGFRVMAALDVDPKTVGRQIEGLTVRHFDDLDDVIAAEGIQMAILAVPADAAQNVTDELVRAGVGGILNFAPVTLNLPKTVSLVGVDLAMELEQLAFAVVKQQRK